MDDVVVVGPRHCVVHADYHSDGVRQKRVIPDAHVDLFALGGDDPDESGCETRYESGRQKKPGEGGESAGLIRG